LYVEALAAPDTINTMPEKTLLAFAEHGKIGALLPDDGGDSEAEIERFRNAGIDIEALAVRLQQDGVGQFVKSWNELLLRIAGKSRALVPTA
jgi:transaldolase